MKTVIEMAREAGFTEREAHKNHGRIERLAELARADEREACAVLAAKLEWSDHKGVASAIRARGNT